MREDKVFVDTNIFIYSVDTNDLSKHKVAIDLIDACYANQNMIISFQVVQEFINTVKKISGKKSFDLSAFCVNVLFPIWEIYPSRDLYMNGLNLQKRYKYSFYDSLIIAAALEGNCNILYSEDLHHEQKIESLTIINPFRKRSKIL